MIFQREILDTVGSKAFALGLLVIAEDTEDDESEEYCFIDILIQQFLAARHLLTQKVSAHGICVVKLRSRLPPPHISIFMSLDTKSRLKLTLSAKKKFVKKEMTISVVIFLLRNNMVTTRMHSSRMRTTHLLTVSVVLGAGGGVCPPPLEADPPDADPLVM